MEYDVVFDGQLIDGADLKQAKANVAKLFKIDAAKAERLFSDERTVIKAGVDEATALKYHAAFTRAGAIAVILDGLGMELTIGPEPPTSPPAAEVDTVAPPERAMRPWGTTPVDSSPSRLDMAEAGRAPPPLLARGQPTAPDDMTMADAGAVLVDEPTNVEAPNINTSHLMLADAGADLAEYKVIAAPEYDLSAFELAPPGTAFDEDV
ncbi:MAG: hypothetical protein ACI9W2_001391 [Gammaproteobacteria bacterium]|jgi:hypothetical protein